MTDAASPGDPPAPRWLSGWAAALPAVYFLSLLAVFALPGLRRLPRPVWWVLGAYALSQQLPALLAPDPLLASGLALARTALMLGLIGAGAALGTRRLGVMGLGLAAAFVTALGVALLRGDPLLAQRLTHPYMTSITLGLLGAAGIWIALFASGRVGWRVPLGVAGLVVLLLTGSRGALAAAVLGAALGLAVRSGRRLAAGLLIGAAALTGIYVAGQQLGLPALERLGTTDTSGRDVIWYSTLSVIESAPVAGVGSYLLGDRLAPPGDVCTLWPTAEGAAPCPAWIARLGHPWLIAHNVTLQQLAETGPLGLLGLFVLLGVVVAAAAAQRNALGIAVLSGLLLATANDNTLLVPGPFVGELFWITAGTVLVDPAPVEKMIRLGGIIGCSLLLLLSLPFFADQRDSVEGLSQDDNLIIAKRSVSSTNDYVIDISLDNTLNNQRILIQSCVQWCSNLKTVEYSNKYPYFYVNNLRVKIRNVPKQTLKLAIFPLRGGFSPRPLAILSWDVVLK